MKKIFFLVAVTLVFMEMTAPASAQLCEPNSWKSRGIFDGSSCTLLVRDGKTRTIPVGRLLFEEHLAVRFADHLIVRVDGITSRPTKLSHDERGVTLTKIEYRAYGNFSFEVSSQYELRVGELLQIRTLSSSLNIEIVGMTHDAVALKIR